MRGCKWVNGRPFMHTCFYLPAIVDCVYVPADRYFSFALLRCKMIGFEETFVHAMHREDISADARKDSAERFEDKVLI